MSCNYDFNAEYGQDYFVIDFVKYMTIPTFTMLDLSTDDDEIDFNIPQHEDFNNTIYLKLELKTNKCNYSK